jgi:predicted O-methyltransferase YrrM
MLKTSAKSIQKLAKSRSSIKKALKGEIGNNVLRHSEQSLHSDWPMAQDSLNFIINLIADLKPKHILEFGSGLSTYVMGEACRLLKLRCKITSIDHDPEFGASVAKRYFTMPQVSKSINFVLAPLVARSFGGKYLPSYYIKPAQARSIGRADLVLIDGPPTYLGGREGILYQTMGFAVPGTIALLDDANRNEEKHIISNWQDALGNNIEVNLLTAFKKGLAAVIISEPVQKDDLYRHKIKLTELDICELIGENEPFIIVDDEMCVRANITSKRKVINFTEKNGKYWKPSDVQDAIQMLETLRKLGAKYIVFVWPSFWWFNYYNGIQSYLKSKFRCIIENNRLVIFSLQKA